MFKVWYRPNLQLSLAVLDSEGRWTGEWAGVSMSRLACSCLRCGCFDHAEFPPLVRVANYRLASEFFLR